MKMTEKQEMVISASYDNKSIEHAFKKAKKLPGIADMSDPHYKLIFGQEEEIYFLWLHEDQGTIMNFKDTHAIYILPEFAVEKVNDIFKKVEETRSVEDAH
ncbi:hypothetical protein V1502_11050 [Bacillus sp. SCS-153A]|uniref:hypothetical protein n=1 Tax=Rossellomorea sedimentorum TaxID=3115294 RepID=UPI003905BECC